MVVHEPHRLHEGVGGGRPDEAETAAAKVPGERGRLWGPGNGAEHRPGEPPGPGPGLGLEAPEVRRERAHLPAEFQRAASIPDGRLDLAAVAHDARLLEELLHAARAEAGHARRVEALELPAEGGPLPQDGEPGQPRLKSLEAKLLEELRLVGDWEAPLLIVVGDVVGRGEAPAAAETAIGSGSDPAREPWHDLKAPPLPACRPGVGGHPLGGAPATAGAPGRQKSWNRFHLKPYHHGEPGGQRPLGSPSSKAQSASSKQTRGATSHP